MTDNTPRWSSDRGTPTKDNRTKSLRQILAEERDASRAFAKKIVRDSVLFTRRASNERTKSDAREGLASAGKD